MTMNEDRVTVYQGENKTLNFRLVDERTKNPFDLTLATEIEAIFPTTAGPSLIKLKSLSQVIVINAVGGRFDVPLVPTETAGLQLGEVVPVEIRVTIAGLISIIQIPQALNVAPSILSA